MHSIGPIRQTGPIDLRDDAHSEKQPLRELGMLKGRFAIQVPNPVPETKFRLACIAHKCLDISERFRLWQQDIPATPEHPAAVFLEKGFKQTVSQHFRKGLYLGRGSV